MSVSMILRAVRAGPPVPGEFNHAGLDEGKRSDKGLPLALPLGVALITPPHTKEGLQKPLKKGPLAQRGLSKVT